jgi:hypothetical protein
VGLLDTMIQKRMEHLGLQSQEELCALFGCATIGDVLIQALRYNGPLWYHGTTVGRATQITAHGLDFKRIGSRTKSLS